MDQRKINKCNKIETKNAHLQLISKTTIISTAQKQIAEIRVTFLGREKSTKRFYWVCLKSGDFFGVDKF